MKYLPKISSSVGICDQDDVSKMIPDIFETYYKEVAAAVSNIVKCEEDTKSIMPSDPYFVGDRCGCPTTNWNATGGQATFGNNEEGVVSNLFGGYASTMHIDLNHKCYDYGNSVPVNSSNNQKGSGRWDSLLLSSLHRNLTNMTLELLTRALIAKGYEKDRNFGGVYSIFQMIISFAEICPSLVQGILSVDVCKKNHPGWDTAVIIQVSDLNDPHVPTLRRCIGELKRVGFSIKLSGAEAVMNTMKFSENPSSGTIINWAFGVDVRDGITNFIFTHHRAQECNQYKITVESSDHMRVNVPENVTMLVNAGKTFLIDVYPTTSGFTMTSLTVNGTKYILSLKGIHQLSEEKGLVVLEHYSEGGLKEYQIQLNSVKEDMSISIGEMYADKSNSFYLKENENSPIFDIPHINQDIITSSIIFEFDGATKLLRPDYVKVYGIPLRNYADAELPQYKCFSEIIQGSYGFGRGSYYKVDFNIPKSFVTNNTAIIRVVFEQGALSGNRIVKTQAEMEFVNAPFGMQFEVDLTTNKILSTYVEFMTPGSQWNPVVPSEILKNSVKLSQVDTSSQYYDLIETGNYGYGSYELKVSPGFTGSIPVGIPEDSIYKAVSDVYNKEEVGTDFNYAVLSIPVGIIGDNMTNIQLGDSITIPRINVRSDKLVQFNIDCSTSGITRDYANEIDWVTYIDAKRPYLNGYVDIPISFDRDDIIVIDIPSFNINLTINVNLPAQEDENTDVSDDNVDENQGSESIDDTPITGDTEEQVKDSTEEETTGSEDTEENPGNTESSDTTAEDTTEVKNQDKTEDVEKTTESPETILEDIVEQ